MNEKKKRQKMFPSPEMTEKFASYPAKTRVKLLSLRELIFEVASKTKGVGELEETFRGGAKISHNRVTQWQYD